MYLSKFTVHTHAVQQAHQQRAAQLQAALVRSLEPGLRRPRAKEPDTRRKNVFMSATLLYSCACGIFLDQLETHSCRPFSQNCAAIAVNRTDVFSGYKAVTVLEVGLVRHLKHPACGSANSAQGCIALCYLCFEPMQAIDLDQIERIRGQLAELDVPEAPPPLTSEELQYFWDRGNKRRPLPPNHADNTKVNIVDGTRR